MTMPSAPSPFSLAARRGMHVVGFPLLLACALLAPRAAHGQAGGPVEAALKYFEASKAGRCAEVWRSFSAGTQENIRAEVHRHERERSGLPQTEVPETRYCGIDGTLKRGSARLARQQRDEAVVAADFSVRLPAKRSDFFPKYVVQTKEVRLVREGDAWRVELPRVPIGREGMRLVEVGPVDVFHPERSFYDLATRMEATAVSRTPRAALESALHDPQRWSRVLPSVTAVEPLERAGELERVRLSFAEPERTLTVGFNVPGKQPSDPTQTTDSALRWNVEGGNKAPVYFRGSWELHTHQDGSTRVTLILLIIPKEWPDDATERIFSAERMAQAVMGFEAAAREPAP